MKKVLTWFCILLFLGFTAAEKAKVRGELSVSQRPIRDIDVSLKRVPAGEIVQTQKTDNRGIFTFENIEAGDYQIEATNIQIQNPSDMINGRISKDKAIRSDLEVLLFKDGHQLFASTRTNSKGEFSFGELEPGSYNIIIVLGKMNSPEGSF